MFVSCRHLELVIFEICTIFFGAKACQMCVFIRDASYFVEDAVLGDFPVRSETSRSLWLSLES